MSCEVAVLICVIAAWFTGFLCGQMHGCDRGGCYFHGKNYKVRP
jgi:hypothetical protein